MAKYPNQKTYVIDKIQLSEYFASYDKLGISNACSVLNGSGFKVWCYLLSNIDEFKWSISPQHAENEWGIKRSTFYDGLKELEEKGFIDTDKRIIHQFYKSEVRTEKKSENRQESPNLGTRESENDHSNNNNLKSETNNNINRDINIAVVKPKEREFVF